MPPREPKIYRLNRMYLALARDEKEFLENVFGGVIKDVDSVDELPKVEVDVLVVGRQHLGDSGYRYGYELVWPAVLRCRPGILVYSLPGAFERHRYEQDADVLKVIGEPTRKFVLELAVLQDLLPDEAIRSARRNLARATSAAPTGEPERLVTAEWTDSNARAHIRDDD
ncbi:MAG: hypothetical protein R3A78_03535 [Polyangiales bacterium]|nr:hypothetical protein [Myxococcales bacterium]